MRGCLKLLQIHREVVELNCGVLRLVGGGDSVRYGTLRLIVWVAEYSFWE